MVKLLDRAIDFVREKMLTIYITINILYVFVCSYLQSINKIKMLTFSKGFIVLLLINIIIAMFLVKTRYRKNKIDLFLLLIIIFGFISTVYAYNFDVALFGVDRRNEGLFTISYYMSLVFLSSFVNKKDKKFIIGVILLTGFIQILYALVEKYKYLNTVFRFNNFYFIGFTTNPNFFGTYILLCILYSIGLYFNNKNQYLNFLYVFLIYVFSLGLLIIDTLSALVGLLGVMFLLLFFSIKFKKMVKYLIVVLILIFSLLFCHCLKITTLLDDLINTTKETTNIISGDLNDNYGTSRLFVWKRTIPLIPKYLIKGVGIDNFRYVLDGHPIKKNGVLYDKAHNEYLQILITMGIFSFISYLCLYFLVLKSGIKKINTNYYLVLPIIGYLIQALFNISVIEVAPIFYIGLGLIIERDNYEESKNC